MEARDLASNKLCLGSPSEVALAKSLGARVACPIGQDRGDCLICATVVLAFRDALSARFSAGRWPRYGAQRNADFAQS
jgi:hypothetical protein